MKKWIYKHHVDLIFGFFAWIGLWFMFLCLMTPMEFRKGIAAAQYYKTDMILNMKKQIEKQRQYDADVYSSMFKQIENKVFP